ncbi:hypothetical protein CALCODRAFT_512921 [Calocera cornea HHB12733]|uniref:Uncharacterized protein n=1 Tax=Calocera cornea HHB12733 TaxID=1353952 RepID=A0A165CMZ4_9BASI|nr:hypothetical protein CALCODRAFT_512921 [Calocera cornea HHB12733]
MSAESILDDNIKRLNVAVQRLKDKAAASPSLPDSKLKKTVLQVFGIWEEIKERQRDCTKLASSLIWITDQVINRLPSYSWAEDGTDATAQALSVALLKDSVEPEIPTKPTVFLGRDALVTSIVRLLLETRPSRIPVLGTGGIGKTSLAITAINNPDVLAKYGRNILFFSCESSATADSIVQGMAAYLGLKLDSNTRVTLFAHLRSRGWYLLVLDNLETAMFSDDSQHVEQLLEELSRLPRLSLLVTMRGDIPPASIVWDSLDVLNTLSLDAAGQIWNQVARKKDDQLDVLLAKLDGLPLAIQLMAKQGRYLTPTQLLASYETSATKLMKIGSGGRLGCLQVSIEVSLGSKLMLEDPYTRDLLWVLSLLPDGATADTLQKMQPSQSSDVLQAISTLRQVALAFEINERLKVLSPIRDIIRGGNPPTSQSPGELFTYCVEICLQVQHVGTNQMVVRVDDLSPEFANINSVLLFFWRKEPATGRIEELLQATWHAAYFSLFTKCSDPAPLLKEARGRLEALSRFGDAAECARRLGDMSRIQSRYDEALALLNEATMAFEVIHDPLGVARCLRKMADVRRMQSNHEEAVPLFQRAMSAFKDLGHRRGAAQCMRGLGEVLRIQSRYKEALPLFEQAKSVFEDLGQPLAAAQCQRAQSVWCLGEVRRMQLRIEDAKFLLGEAKLGFQAINEPLGAAKCLASWAEILRSQSRLEEAAPVYEEARLAFEVASNQAGQAFCIEMLGRIRLTQKRYDEARPLFVRAKSMYEDLGRMTDVLDCEKALAKVQREAGP